MGNVVKIHKDSEKNPFLPYGGQYGPGLEHEADVEVFQFESDVKVGDGPAYDRDCKRSSYCLFVFRVRYEDMLVFARRYEPTGANTNSKALKYLRALNVPMTETPDGDLVFDDKDVVGIKCGIEVKPPRTGTDGTQYTGDVTNVIGL